MKNQNWLLYASIVLINILRLVLSCLMFWRFFLFRMSEVTMIFLAYMLLDSLEGWIVYRDRRVWGPVKIIFHYINDTLFLFAIISGILLRLPVVYFLMELGKDMENVSIVKTWMACTVTVFIIVVVIGATAESGWGNIQNLGSRFCFLGYCAYCLYPERWAMIFIIILSAIFILGVEIKKYGWDWKELRKKDIRFRHPDTPLPPFDFK